MQVSDLYSLLDKNHINFFCGVPDSLLKDFCAYIFDNTDNNIITANEGNAIGLAAGHFLSTGYPACVYMQNSGLGNAINPLVSLTDKEVYNIPLLMIIGLRGEVGLKDEPQHIKQGAITDKLLNVLGIKYEILPKNFKYARPIIESAIQYMNGTLEPFAFIIKKNTFDRYEFINKKIETSTFAREEAIETVLSYLSEKDVIVSSTGFISREIYEIREKTCEKHKQDFLVIGSMGHASSIALGVALEKPDRNVFCLEGDGSFIMHEGVIGVIGSKNLNNYKHIVFNNEAHDSVGGWPTVASNINITKVAFYSGYKKIYSVSSKNELINVLPEFILNNSLSILEIKVKCGAKSNLGRPKESTYECKKNFMKNLLS